MNRREFLGAASAVTAMHAVDAFAVEPQQTVKPFDLGLLIVPYSEPETKIKLLRELGFKNCYLSLDGYINTGGDFTPEIVELYRGLLKKYEITVTAVEVVGPPPLEWNFLRGPSTIGLIPPATRAARIDALRKASDFAHKLGIEQVQTHCGFMPEDPADPLYPQAVEAIRKVAEHCKSNGQYFLMETGQETPTTMSRMLRDVAMPNLAVGLDTANLILYGKANPVDAVDILGPHIRGLHAKDGKWPTDPSNLGEEVKIGEGLVNFREVFRKLHAVGYKGAVTIERETSGPQQIADVKDEKRYLERALREAMA
jgi:L-ribulose-5-phosphate 3-epimerase